LERYGLAEEIVHFKRRWFVVADDALDVLSELLAKRKAIRDTTVADETEPSEFAASSTAETAFD
jgi:hypothetical protein